MCYFDSAAGCYQCHNNLVNYFTTCTNPSRMRGVNRIQTKLHKCEVFSMGGVTSLVIYVSFLSLSIDIMPSEELILNFRGISLKVTPRFTEHCYICIRSLCSTLMSSCITNISDLIIIYCCGLSILSMLYGKYRPCND